MVGIYSRRSLWIKREWLVPRVLKIFTVPVWTCPVGRYIHHAFSLFMFFQDTMNSASSLTRTLSNELSDGQRKLMALAVSGASSNTGNPLIRQISNGPSGFNETVRFCSWLCYITMVKIWVLWLNDLTCSFLNPWPSDKFENVTV